MKDRLYSARTKEGFEDYNDHIRKCLEKFEGIFPVFCHSLCRIFDCGAESGEMKSFFEKMVLCHDLGKLTKKWQQCLAGEGEEDDNKKRKMPAHASIGAAYLWKTLPEKYREPIAFAVCIHHTDSGLLGENIEKPDVRAILDGIVDNDGKIIWDEKIKGHNPLIPEDLADAVDIDLLREMAMGLREWSKGCGILEQHKRRLMVALTHHLLKLCDISAASERAEYVKTDGIYGGWRMVAEIEKYVASAEKRGRR